MKGTFNIGKQDVLLKDMNKKLQRMLEETLMKNIEMQKVRVYFLCNIVRSFVLQERLKSA